MNSENLNNERTEATTSNKISADTIIRTIVLLIAIMNEVLVAFGKNPLPFAEETLYVLLSNIVMIAAAFWAWWKNNSFTKEAIAADKYMENLKNPDSNS